MLRGGLNTFGNHLQPHGVAQHQYRSHNGLVVGIAQDIAHEGTVDLELRQWQALEVGQ